MAVDVLLCHRRDFVKGWEGMAAAAFFISSDIDAKELEEDGMAGGTDGAVEMDRDRSELFVSRCLPTEELEEDVRAFLGVIVGDDVTSIRPLCPVYNCLFHNEVYIGKEVFVKGAVLLVSNDGEEEKGLLFVFQLSFGAISIVCQIFLFLIEVIRVDRVVNISLAISQGVVVKVVFITLLVLVWMLEGLCFLLVAFI